MVRRLSAGHRLQGVRRFHEEEGRLAGRVGAHFPRMGRIVAADAIDAADREEVVGAGNGKGGDRRRGNDVGHGSSR